MYPPSRWGLLGSLILLYVALAVAQYAVGTPSIPMDYCASINTAETSANSSIYQSDGLCYGFCAQDWAVAIVQGKNCWCSDYIPKKDFREGIDECRYACPGYPNDTCGSPTTWGYMLLDIEPKGERGKSSTASESETTSTAQSTSIATTTSSDPETTSITSSTSTTTSSSSSSSSTSSSSTSSTSTSASTSAGHKPLTPSAVETVTIGGRVSTVFVSPTDVVKSSPTDAEDSSGSDDSGLSTGAKAGIAVGIVGAFLIAGAILFIWWWRRRKQRQASGAGVGAIGGTTDTGSRTGSAGFYGARSEMTDAGRYAAAAADARSTESSENSQRRRSQLMPMDPRLDPHSAGGMYVNRSQESFNTLRDDQDYSRRVHDPPRVLRATNPDLDE